MVNFNALIERTTSFVGDVTDHAGRFTRQAGGVAEGLRHRVTGTPPKRGMDDTTITRKVETVVFRPEGAPKGSVNVNTVDGVVYLRGEVKNPGQIKSLEGTVRKIPEVRDVENLLHLPKTPAPTRADAPRSQQKTRRTKPRSAAHTAPRSTGRVNEETRTATGEPGPDELAARRAGRGPAPLGAEDPDAGA